MYNIYIKTDKWKATLKKIIGCGKKKGFSDNFIEHAALALTCGATTLSVPDTEGEKVFFDLWYNASYDEKIILIRLLLRIIEQ